MVQPSSLFGFVGRARLQELNPVFQPILSEDKDDLFEFVISDSTLAGGSPELLLQPPAILHIIIEIRPNHERRVSTHRETGSKLARHAPNDFTSASARHKPTDAGTHRPYPTRIKSFEKSRNKDPVNAPPFLALMQADNLGSATHEPTPS